MKKFFGIAFAALIATTCLTACGSDNSSEHVASAEFQDRAYAAYEIVMNTENDIEHATSVTVHSYDGESYMFVDWYDTDGNMHSAWVSGVAIDQYLN